MRVQCPGCKEWWHELQLGPLGLCAPCFKIAVEVVKELERVKQELRTAQTSKTS